MKKELLILKNCRQRTLELYFSRIKLFEHSLYHTLVFWVFFLASFGAINILGVKASYLLYGLSVGVIAFTKLSIKSWIYVCLIAASLILSTLLSGAIERIEMLFYHLFFLILAVSLYFRRAQFSVEFIRRIARVVLFTLITLTALQLFQISNILAFDAINFPSISYLDTVLPGAGFSNPNNNAYYIFFAWVLLSFLDVKFAEQKINYIDLLVGLCMLVTASRYFTVCFFTIMLFKFLDFKKIKYLVPLVPILIYGYLQLFDFLSSNNVEFYFSKLEALRTIELTNTLEARFEYLGYFLSFDWVPFGLRADYSEWSAPHSFVFELTFMYGIVGLLCVLVPLAYVVLYSIRGASTFSGAMGNAALIAIIFFGWFIPSTLSISALNYLLCLLFAISAQRSPNHAL